MFSAGARDYNRIKIKLRLFDIFFVIFYLAVFQFFLSGRVKEFVFSFTENFYPAFALYVALFSVFYYIVAFPLSLYSGFMLEHKFKLSNQTFGAWLKDDLKKSALSLAVFLIFTQALYAFLRGFPDTWWLWMAGFWFLFTVFLARIMPIFVVPLFFKYFPVEENLRQNILELAGKCGIKIIDVYKIDFSKKTNKLNADVVGLGKTRRVIMADNLINEFSRREINGVLAHEFAHHKLRHIPKFMLFGFISTFISFYAMYLLSSKAVEFFAARGVYDMALFPVFMFILFAMGFAIMPIKNAFSRKLEKDSDIFALKVTRDREAFASLMKKLAEKNLSDPSPHPLVKFLFYDHPPVSERVKLAETFRL